MGREISCQMLQTKSLKCKVPLFFQNILESCQPQVSPLPSPLNSMLSHQDPPSPLLLS